MPPPRWVFVHEYITGGGWGPRPLPSGLSTEAAAILRAVLADFRACGGVRTLTTADWRLEEPDLQADCVLRSGPGQYPATFASALAHSEVALIIAPETGGILADLSVRCLAAGVPLLGSGPEAVRLAGNKWQCYRRWEAAHVPTPLTRLVAPPEAAEAAALLGYPVVAKPLDGVGCAGVGLACDPSQVAAAVALAEAESGDGQPILLQRYVPGKHASVALLAAREEFLPLSLNFQDVAEGPQFVYRGGAVPYPHPSEARALAVAQAAARAIPGLRGFAGVDLVLAGDDAWAIEINPRLTTSYVGLREVIDINLAGAIWEACLDGLLPKAVTLHGLASFDKEGRVYVEERR